LRLIGAVLLEANDEWQLQHRYMGVEAMGELLSPPPANETLQLPPKAACVVRPDVETAGCAVQAAKSRLAGGH
jgi:hypothetical protein